MRDIIVLGCGPSVRQYNLRGLEDHGQLIAVNAAALYVKPDIAFTMDRKAAEFCFPLWCIQGIPQMYLRECIMKNIKLTKNTRLFQRENDVVKMSDKPGELNGSNSGTCALNLAFQLRPQRVFLLGFDMQRGEDASPYWHPVYPWSTTGAVRDGRYASWAKEFDDIASDFRARDIEVFNVNHHSLITAFPIITYDKFLEMTK